MLTLELTGQAVEIDFSVSVGAVKFAVWMCFIVILNQLAADRRIAFGLYVGAHLFKALMVEQVLGACGERVRNRRRVFMFEHLQAAEALNVNCAPPPMKT